LFIFVCFVCRIQKRKKEKKKLTNKKSKYRHNLLIWNLFE
jgi:hypothetical protein